MSELYHYGVPGQKHGSRRYQYEDGSLTPEGKIHYGVGDGRKSKTIYQKMGTKLGKSKLVQKNIKAQKNATATVAKTNKIIKNKVEKYAEVKKKNMKAELAIAGIVVAGTAAAAVAGLMLSHKSDKISDIKKTPVIDADDWEVIGKLKFKDIGADSEYYNSDSYRYKSKY